MASERMQRRLERLLDQIDEAEANGDWKSVRSLALDALEFDNENSEASVYLRVAERRIAESGAIAGRPQPSPAPLPDPTTTATDQPSSFASGRYEVKRFLGEGGKKKVYLGLSPMVGI